MVNALKKVDKKILIIAGIILFLPIFIIVFLAIIQGCSNSKIIPEEYEKKMISAAETYFTEKEKMPKNESETKTVKLSTLVKGEYIKSTEKLLDDDSCKGSVTVRKNGSNIIENEGGFLNYTVNLECKEYKTNTLLDSIMLDLTTEGSGLYEDNNYYVYKGDEVDNYINFFDVNYRIVNIDSNGLIKLIKVNSEPLDRYWDNKYNVEINDLYGKNIYSDSEILKYLISDYNNKKVISSGAKKHIVSNDICIDARDFNDGSIGNYDCTAKIEKQVVSLIDISDFAKASIDPDCNSIYSRSCGNYNYLKSLNLKTWTVNAVSNNTYQVYYLTNGMIKMQQSSRYENYNLVIYIDGREKLVSGTGTESDPFIVK